MKPAPALAGAAAAALLLASVIGLFTVGDDGDDDNVSAPTIPSTTSTTLFLDTTTSSIDTSSTTQAVPSVESTTTTSGQATTSTTAPGGTQRRILAVESVNGVDQIVRIDPSSGASSAVTTSGAAKADPAYTPDGQHLVFSEAGNIVFIHTEGHSAQVIARSGGSTTFFDPMITQDLKRLVVEQRTACNPQPCTPATRVTLFTLATNESRQIGGQGGFDPALSPDGNQVAMVEGNSLVTFDITAPDPNGTRVVIADGPGLSGPAWSPDGSRIAFTQTDGGVSRLATVGSGGQARAPVSADLSGSRPSWSRDGRTLVFVQGDDVVARAPLSVVNADGSGLRGIPGPARDAPAW